MMTNSQRTSTGATTSKQWEVFKGITDVSTIRSADDLVNKVIHVEERTGSYRFHKNYLVKSVTSINGSAFALVQDISTTGAIDLDDGYYLVGEPKLRSLTELSIYAFPRSDVKVYSLQTVLKAQESEEAERRREGKKADEHREHLEDLANKEFSRRCFWGAIGGGLLLGVPGVVMLLKNSKEPTPKEIVDAAKMVDSYSFDINTGVSTFTVPAGVTDVEAMKALTEYFKKYHARFKRDAVCESDLIRLWNLPKEFPAYCQERDYSHSRQVTITGVVKGTEGENRTTQEGVVKKESLVFSDPRDQALAAAIHACKHDGEDLFKGLTVRCSVPGLALYTSKYVGVSVVKSYGDFDSAQKYPYVAASGSTSPESK